MTAILIVDDEFALVETLKDFLEDAGYRVETASNGHEGLEVMKRSRPHLVLTDLMMPVMSGKEILSAMRGDAQLASIPVILMSAARRQVAVRPGEGFPSFSTFLRKPFLLRTLMEAIIKLVGQAEQGNKGNVVE